MVHIAPRCVNCAGLCGRWTRSSAATRAGEVGGDAGCDAAAASARAIRLGTASPAFTVVGRYRHGPLRATAGVATQSFVQFASVAPRSTHDGRDATDPLDGFVRPLLAVSLDFPCSSVPRPGGHHNGPPIAGRVVRPPLVLARTIPLHAPGWRPRSSLRKRSVPQQNRRLLLRASDFLAEIGWTDRLGEPQAS